MSASAGAGQLTVPWAGRPGSNLAIAIGLSIDENALVECVACSQCGVLALFPGGVVDRCAKGRGCPGASPAG